MPSIGPDLPPHLLAKRKRQAEAETTSSTSQADRAPSKSPDAGEKRRRVAGPAPPPAPLEERPPHGPDEDDGSSSSDDDFGPALPTGDEPEVGSASAPIVLDTSSKDDTDKRLQRDEWMMIPPKQDDLAARMDPTKIRPRKFNSGKGPRAPETGGGNSLWTETAEQKQKRLQNEVLGIVEPATAGGVDTSRRPKERSEESARRIKAHAEKTRGQSLYATHQKNNKVEEDDPTKRAFDREKDMSIGVKIGHAQKKEMINKAANFGSRFSGGGFL